MSRINDDVAARKIMEDIEAMNNQAKVSGVSAYLQKPRRVPRPNERFLRNTIANVQHANRRVDEEEMWALYEQRRKREAGEATMVRSGADHDDQQLPERQRDTLKEESSLKRDRDESGAVVPRDKAHNDDDDGDLEEFLAGRTKRGRGSRGPQADAPGPYLAAGAAEEKEALEEQASRSAKKRELGPNKPRCLGDATHATDDTSGLNRRGGSKSDSSGSDSERRSRKEREKKRKKSKSSKEKKEKRKSKSDKKDKKKKRKSERKDKKKKKRRRRSRSPSTSSSLDSR